MNKVTFQFAAIVDTHPNVITDFKGDIRHLRLSEYNPLSQPFMDAAAFLNALEKEVRKAYNLTGFIDFEDVTPDLPPPTGPHEGPIGFGSFREDS